MASQLMTEQQLNLLLVIISPTDYISTSVLISIVIYNALSKERRLKTWRRLHKWFKKLKKTMSSPKEFCQFLADWVFFLFTGLRISFLMYSLFVIVHFLKVLRLLTRPKIFLREFGRLIKDVFNSMVRPIATLLLFYNCCMQINKHVSLNQPSLRRHFLKYWITITLLNVILLRFERVRNLYAYLSLRYYRSKFYAYFLPFLELYLREMYARLVKLLETTRLSSIPLSKESEEKLLEDEIKKLEKKLLEEMNERIRTIPKVQYLKHKVLMSS